MRTGQQYLDSLNDGRTVILDGKVVENVAAHPAFAGIRTSISELYDIAANPANDMLFHSPEIDGPANLVFNIPRSPEELDAKRRAIETWSQHAHGWIGRSPDHVGNFFAGFASHPEVFVGEDGDVHDYGDNVRRFYERILRENLYVTYAIIPPQNSRATTTSGWEGEFLQVGVVRETDEGIIVRGSQMLATGGPVTDEVFVTCIKPMGPDDQDFALSFALPTATPGMKMYCRRPYHSTATSSFDYPLTMRYDEHDVFLVFDDVLVPWDRVFINRNLVALRSQFFETGAHLLGNWQAQIRLTTKLKFIAAVAHKVTKTNGTDRIPGVQEKLGELASVVSCVESAVTAAQHTAEADQNGVYIPGRRALYGIMGLQSEVYPRAIHILRDLVGGGVMQIPSSVEDLHSQVSKSDIAQYLHSPGVISEDRIKLFKLAWDIIGSEFAGRHQQYEMFYAGAPFVVKGAYTYRNFGYEELVQRLDEFLDSYSSQDSINASEVI